ncbi:alpha/beta hydrolase [Flavobacterium sp.]|uniref:alpha/beta hydrolase n=1 Tax=Flavobacterium sp. TaxID=239 RepID=UPI003D6BBC55
MKTISFLIFLFLSTSICHAQEMFEYEKKIRGIENFKTSELEFYNSKENIKLYGTLIEPKSPYDKIIIIVPGSGKDTRNNHPLLTENFLSNGIAVLRYDERGTGLSEGVFSTANYTITDMSDDLTVIFNTIKNNTAFASKKIGLIGHSQGGMVTMTLIEKGLKPDFLLQWAAPVQKHGAFFKYQLKTGINKFEDELIFESDEKKLEVMDIFQQAFGGTPIEEDWKTNWKPDWKISKKALKEATKAGYTSKNYKRFHYANFVFFKHILKKNFEDVYKTIEIPTLYVIGTDDKYVDPISETAVLKSFQNDKIKILVFENLNHYLTRGELSLSTMYEIDNLPKNEITNWIKNQ